MDNFNFWFSLIASAASILGLAIAIVQTININKIRLENKRKTWTKISTIKALMRNLEAKKIDTAYGSLCELFRELLQEAVLLENQITSDTIKKWRKAGKISSDWQEYQLYQILTTTEIDIKQIPERDVPLSVYDTTLPDDEVAKAPENPHSKK